MKNLFKSTNAPKEPSLPVVSTFLHGYRSNGPKRHHSLSSSAYETALFVVFDDDTQRRFSSVRIVLYCDASSVNSQFTWMGSVTHTCKGHVDHARPNDPALPQLAVAFKLVPCSTIEERCELVLRSSDDELHDHDDDPVCVLLDSEHSVTPDTLFLSVAFGHSIRLHTLSTLFRIPCGGNITPVDYVDSHTVRVVPAGRPRMPVFCIPTDILLMIFEAIDSCGWQHDLLSFTQVCRQWTCSMRVLFARLESPKWVDRCSVLPKSLDTCLLAHVLSKTPALGLGVHYLDIDQHNGSLACRNHVTEKASSGFNPALMVILRATKNLQSLHLSQGHSSQANAIFLALPKLHALHTLSITWPRCPFSSMQSGKYWIYSINIAQLVRCMARWPTLTSLTVEHISPGNLGMQRFFLRPPTCALRHLCIRHSEISDKDLLYLTASSAKTLTHVTLERVISITRAGLRDFLDSISQNVISLTVRDVITWLYQYQRPAEHALDAVVDKMRCLQVLSIRGDMATWRMFVRRSEVFVRGRESGNEDVPVVRVSFVNAPGIESCTGDEWPGWEAVEFD